MRLDAAWVVLLTMAALTLFLKLDYANLFLFDESLYCGVTADMAAHGQWLYPTDGGVFWGIYGKPPVINWLQAAATWLLGWSVFSLRLPTALGMLGLIALTGLTASRLLGRHSGLCAAGMMLLSARLVHTGRHILLENLVAPLFAASLLLYAFSMRDVKNGDSQESWRPMYVVAAGLCMALGILTKQAFGLFAPAAVVLAEVTFRRRGWMTRLAIAGGVTVAASAWWFVATYLEVGGPFLDSFMGYHVTARFAGALEGHVRGLNAYAASLDDNLRVMPWALAAIGWVSIYPRLKVDWLKFLFVAWTALSGIEFFVVGVAVKTFLPWYQWVVMPPLFIGAAHVVVTWLQLSSVPRWVRFSVPLTVVTAAAVSARLDAVISLVVAGVVVIQFTQRKFLDRVSLRHREIFAVGLVGVLGIVVANPWHGGDGRYRVSEMIHGYIADGAHVTVAGDDWLRVWMCYAPEAERVTWSGSCDEVKELGQKTQILVLDGKAADCSDEMPGNPRELFRGKTKQGIIVALARQGI
jgi:4-amino-4-deoxy-L-arabinose transferase-like glycosyltransferase